MNDALVRPVSLSVLRAALHERGLAIDGPESSEDPVVRGVEQHSGRIDPGDLFLAWKGTAFDAHERLEEAESRGAVAAVVERVVPGVSIPQLLVPNGRLGAAIAADELYGSPWRDLNLTAITGTNGKTTTTEVVRWMLGATGVAASSIGTLGLVESDGSVREGTESLTTPGPVTMSRWLAELKASGSEAVVVEASSHALDQFRLDGVRFDAAVFTNITQDHLDYHGDFDSYRAAKRRLAELTKDDTGVVVRWLDDGAWDGLEGPGGTVTYSAVRDADLRALDLEASTTGTRFGLRYRGAQATVQLPLVGQFNVENALAASGVALHNGHSLDEVAQRLSATPQVAGRLERVLDDPFRVLIDYAHTPDALERVLRTLRPLTEGRVIVVFGAGGDRDRTKRPRMGQAATLADVIVVTSDNPRTEHPDAIIDDIVPGLGDAPHTRIADRIEAVRYALDQARPDDVVLLAGKGHERYQVLGTEVVHLDEREVVAEWLGGAS